MSKILFLTLFSPLTLVNFYGVIIVNMLKKTLASLFAASAMLAVAQSAAADTMDKTKTDSKAQARALNADELAKPNPDLKIESVNEKFAKNFPNQYDSWKKPQNPLRLIPQLSRIRE